MRRPAVWLVLLPLLLAACGDGADDGDGDSAKGGAASSPTVPSYAAARVSTGHKPCGILGVDGTVWVSNYGDNTLVTVDPASGEVGDPVPTGGAPCGLASGAGSIWVEDFGSDQVTRISAGDGTVQATYDVGDQPYDVTFADGAAWATNYGDGTVSRIDAGSGKVTSIDTGGTPIGIAPAGGKVWVGLGVQGIAAIDTRTGVVSDTLATDGAAGWTAYDDDHVWVNVDATVVQVDPATATITRTVAVGDQPLDGTVADGRVWVGDGGAEGDLFWFPVDGDDTQAQSVPSTVHNPFVAAELDGQLWVVDFVGTDVVRLDPAQID
jgi:YVTN family beta-propeller protein